MTNTNLNINVLKITQPAGDFYVGSMRYQDLLEIAYYDPRVKTQGDEYSGIQRPLNKDRIKAINAYLSSLDATLPNAIIVSLPNGFELKDTGCEGLYQLQFEKKTRTVLIVDGQHRLEGFKGLKVDSFDLIVTFLIDLQEEDEAMIFATINGTQTRVNPSLVYDLYGLTSGRSPQKTVHEIVKRLNSEDSSPFYKLIKMLGRREEDYAGVISQSAFAKKLVQFISKDLLRDRDLIARKRKLPYTTSDEENLIFLSPFLEERDDYIYNILKNYFNAIRKLYPADWGSKRHLLTKTIGVHAYLEYLRFMYPEIVSTRKATEESFIEILKSTRTTAELTSSNYSVNESGVRTILNELINNSRYPWTNVSLQSKIKRRHV